VSVTCHHQCSVVWTGVEKSDEDDDDGLTPPDSWTEVQTDMIHLAK
jgi:hypothetical protein